MQKSNENILPSFFSILTADIRYNKDLSAQEKILFSEITALTNNKGYCTATNEYFAKLYNVNIRTIQRWLINLKKYNFIEIYVIEGLRRISVNINTRKKKNKTNKKSYSKPTWLNEYENNFESNVIDL